MATMLCVKVIVLATLISSVLTQGSGNAKLRLCLAKGHSHFNRTARYCPVLAAENSGVECVSGVDRLDCLRRIGNGTADFGVFHPEDLVAAQWAGIDALVTSELRARNREFARSIVAVLNERVQLGADFAATLYKTKLCHPGVGIDDIRSLSDNMQRLLESQIPVSCDPGLSVAENRIKAMAEFFNSSCKPGPWVLDAHRDAELKTKYRSLCSACMSPKCGKDDAYWGDIGALKCLEDGAGDVAWVDIDDVNSFFWLKGDIHGRPGIVDDLRFLCGDGSTQSLLTDRPCVWIRRPWPVIVTTRKSAAAVSTIAESLTSGKVVVDKHWHGALANLLEAHAHAHGAQPKPLSPPLPIKDFLYNVQDYAYGLTRPVCTPERYVTLCTTSPREAAKCTWLSEAATVYGIAPKLQCITKPDIKSCMEASQKEGAVVLADSNWLVKGIRDYNLQPLLHEATPVVSQTHTVSAYVRADAGIYMMADIRGKRAAFPEYDGLAWHAVLRYIQTAFKLKCKGINNFFSEICAPGFEKVKGGVDMTASCYKENGAVVSGEVQALRALVEGKTDVAFISQETYNKYKANAFSGSDWAKKQENIWPLCPEENTEHCFISWAGLGHVFASKNLSAMLKQETINVFLKIDKYFGKQHTFHNPMFALYDSFDGAIDVLFHNNTNVLATQDQLKANPYARIPLSFERGLNSGDFCQVADFVPTSKKN